MVDISNIRIKNNREKMSKLLFSVSFFLVINLTLSLAMAGECPDSLEWRKIDPKEIQYNVFKQINDDWMALAVGKKGDMNAMTISSGTFGNMWRMPIVTVFVSTDRYTNGFMEQNEYFTVTAFAEEHRDKLRYLGSHSGRDGDKIKDSGLMVEYSDLGNPMFTDGRLVIECRKIYSGEFDSSQFNEKMNDMYRNGMGVHKFYIGEILNVWVKE